MTVIGVGFNKIFMEKTAPIKGKISIKNHASIKNVEKMELSLGKTKQDALKFIFEFKAIYEPKIGHITLEGEVLWLDKKEAIEDVLKQWKKNKKIPEEVMSPVLNQVLSRSNVEALILSRELNLPPPVPLPKVQLK